MSGTSKPLVFSPKGNALSFAWCMTFDAGYFFPTKLRLSPDTIVRMEQPAAVGLIQLLPDVFIRDLPLVGIEHGIASQIALIERYAEDLGVGRDLVLEHPDLFSGYRGIALEKCPRKHLKDEEAEARLTIVAVM